MNILDLPSDADMVLRELLAKGHHVSGLLRPQDLQTFATIRGNGQDVGKAGSGETTSGTQQIQHARLYAAAALERAHIEACAEGAGGVCDGWQGRGELPPLALSLAASLRHSGASMLGADLSLAKQAMTPRSGDGECDGPQDTWSVIAD